MLNHRTLVTTLAFCLVLGTHAAAQDSRPRPRVKAEDLVNTSIRVNPDTANEILAAAAQFYRRQIDVVQDTGTTTQGSNLALIGEMVLVHDTPEMTKRIIEFIAEVDRSAAAGGRAPEPLLTQMVTPRHVQPQTCLKALRAFTRDVVVSSEGGRARTAPNVTVVDERRMIVLHDTADRIAAMVHAISEVDVAETTVTITCQVLQARASGETAGIDPVLAAHLSQLLPSMKFGVLGFGLARVTVGSVLTLEMDMSDGRTAQLRMQPSAYDPDSASLAVGELQFTLTPSATGSPGSGVRPAQPLRISAATQLKGGEYAVVAAFGEQPVLLVVRLVAEK